VQLFKHQFINFNSANGLLVIEEINRGNCAQIFGDIFQLLDRKDNGFSDYPIMADKDLQGYLAKVFSKEETAIKLSDEDKGTINDLYKDEYEDVVSRLISGEVLTLPSNLYILATMNTSDQSLFPMDSAFKRRWEWKYERISFDDPIFSCAVIELDERHQYLWKDFVTAINSRILEKLESTDKQIGSWFVVPQNGLISRDQFISKVMFYLMTDAFKDMEISDEKFYFEELFNDAEDKKLLHFIEVVLEVKNVAITVEPAPTEEESTPEAENA
jgi:5-methylcytosine-specific restriction endonuclease McrBC GTP-binding regulatory subunit McrB